MSDATAKLLYSEVNGNLRSCGRQRWSETWQVSDWERGEQGDYTNILETDGLPQVGDPVDTKFTNPTTGKKLVLYYVDAVPHTMEPETVVNIVYTLQEDPMGLPLLLSSYAAHKTETVWFDNDNQLIVNKAGTVYIPGLTRTRAITRLEVVKRYSIETWSNFDLADYVDHLNSDDFHIEWTDGNGDDQETFIWPAGTVYLDDIRHPMVTDPYQHMQATFLFLIDEKEDEAHQSETFGKYIGWCKRVPNIGPLFLHSGKLQVMTDDNNVPTGGAGLLDANGDKLPTGSAPVINVFDDIPTTSFSALADEFKSD